MKTGKTLMILAGSAEARILGEQARQAGLNLRALVSEPPRGAQPMPFTLLDFADQEAVIAEMRGCDAVLDASHGFDGVMSHIGYAAARHLGLPILAYVRPLWPVPANANWESAASVAAAMPLVVPGARVFSATGWASLAECAAFPGALLMLRQTHEHPRQPPYDFVDLIFGDPPFSVDSEIALFRRLRADTLICRNLGGRASRPKLDAAQALGMQVILIDRPPLPQGMPLTDDLDAALAWVAAQ